MGRQDWTAMRLSSFRFVWSLLVGLLGAGSELGVSRVGAQVHES
eukprot:CAMPEP_0118946550 /NCGR_PEP_ID=MMETSP1169-20130426/44393_1 /TAXON_ID=36882 /ORGANISM="Pyramimonas obovata, Strain CCMP722" /LENGTH=43 /DNA_ID= /DNA_START= /DNA_END= /DNA_ORIENTATION=